ncbi:MAG TPA: sigma-54 dependent transcriptional regulator [Phycisphaerales bacterium]|nr:sigma-54 dependent transcriptional regulator [Phycisphaerales bacterium]
MSQARPTRVLVVDDDPIVADSLSEFLTCEGFDSSTALNVEEAVAALREAARSPSDQGPRPYAIVVTDVSLPGRSGTDLLSHIGKEHPGVAVVMLTGYGHVEGAVEALRLGAVDYLTKPVVDDELRLALERARRHHTLLAENTRLRRQLDTRYSLDSIVGSDPRMVKIYDLVEAVAPSRTTVLMSGESGTGKSLVAHAIHHRSPRRDQPFVELSCGSIPETLLESELFGHVKGAFTGAHADKPGRFLAAHGGTIFLDEINSASPAMQLKLLRVLQERKFEPVGSNKTIDVDARVILASNQPLERLVAEGHFRQDLFYRINVVMIELPPLRERVSDIPLLAEHFLGRYAAELGRQVVGFSPAALDALRRYPFPGNIRELENLVQRAVVLTKGQTIQAEDLPGQVTGEGGPGVLARMAAATGAPVHSEIPVLSDDTPWSPIPLEEALREPERIILLKALRANDWNRQKTADDLGINRTTLYKKMRALGIDPEHDARRAG